jgi:hypothetical protein
MGNYSNKTCYDCGVKKPANQMERVTESYNSGRSDNTVTAGNVAWAAFSDTAAKKVKRTIVANNRRSYTRNRTVWKCMDCSGTNAGHRAAVVKDISKALKAVKSARMGGWITAKKEISPEIEYRLETLKKLRGTTKYMTSEDLLLEIESMLEDAPVISKGKLEEKVDAFEAKVNAKGVELQEKSESLEAKAQSMAERQDAKHIGKAPMGTFKKIGLWTMFLFGSLLLLAVVLRLHEGEYELLELVWCSFLGLFMTYQPLEVMFFRPKRLAGYAKKGSTNE